MSPPRPDGEDPTQPLVQSSMMTDQPVVHELSRTKAAEVARRKSSIKIGSDPSRQRDSPRLVQCGCCYNKEEGDMVSILKCCQYCTSMNWSIRSNAIAVRPGNTGIATPWSLVRRQRNTFAMHVCLVKKRKVSSERWTKSPFCDALSGLYEIERIQSPAQLLPTYLVSQC